MYKKSIFVVLVSALAYMYFQSRLIEDSPVVSTENGKVKGKVSISRDGKQFFEFLGIPYAKPPEGELRYENPVKPENWEGVRLAQHYGAECAQYNFVVGSRVLDENCLFLNVATPKVGKKAKLAVVVFIHGGLFISSSANGIGANYFIDEDVIVVTMNYRLASLGFLNTGDGVVKGNMGLKDQVFALQWIQSNIENFGGDKNKVTIVGESAGGASVHYHILSPLSKGLFYRAISQSGSVLNPWTLRKNAASQAKRHAEKVGCPTSNSKEMVACLKRLPIAAIVDAHEETSNMFRELPAVFVPTIETVKDGAMISANPYDIIRTGKFNAVPWLSGYNADEGHIFFAFLAKNESGMANMDENLTEEMPKLMMYSNGDRRHQDDLMQKMKQFYFKDTTPAGLQSIDPYSQILTDGMFAYGISEALKLHSEFHPVYPYYYTYHGETQTANLIMALKGEYPILVEVLVYMAKRWVNENILGRQPLLKGAAHADELMLLFQMDQFGVVIKPGDKDYIISKKLVKLWSSFAKGEETVPIEGKTLVKLDPNAKEVNYLRLDEKLEVIPEPNQGRLQFWKANSLLE